MTDLVQLVHSSRNWDVASPALTTPFSLLIFHAFKIASY
jgi:hypothetical protein